MKYLKRVAPFAFIAAVAVILLYLPDTGPEQYSDLETFFQTERGRQGFVGYAVAVVRPAEPPYVAAFGTDGRELPLAPTTPMAIGSLSASFTGLLVLDAVRQGELDIDKPLGDYLPEFRPEAYDAGAEQGRVAPGLRHFLSHTSGFSDRNFDDRHRKASNLADAVSNLIGARPGAKPGSAFIPISSGYQALGLVLQRISGKTYAELLEERIVSPLGMSGTSADTEASNKILPMGSTCFFGTALPRQQELPIFSAASGGIVSTAADMAKYLSYLAEPGRLRKPPLPAATIATLAEPLVPGIDYSYGWRIQEGPSGVALWNSGSLEGFSAEARLWLDEKAGIAILAPQSSLLQSLIAMPSLVEGARRILFDASTERPFPLGRLYVLLAVMAAVHLIALAAQTGGALGWARDVRGKADAAGSDGALHFARLRTLAGIVLRIGALVVAPFMLTLVVHHSITWSDIFTLEPDLGGWFVAAMAFGLLRNVTRLAWLRGPSRR